MGHDRPVLDGRRAIVVGGPDLGRALSTRLQRAGAEVADLHWDASPGIEPNSTGIVGGAVEQAAERLGGVDLLVVDLLPNAAPSPLVRNASRASSSGPSPSFSSQTPIASTPASA